MTGRAIQGAKFVGTPDRVAGQMAEVMEDIGGAVKDAPS